MSRYMDGSYMPQRCARRVREAQKAKSLRQDPYSLAYRYTEYMKRQPMRKRLGDRQYINKYYENLLANQPEPEPGATDDRSRAIQYAKDHHECYYELRDIDRIVRWLDEAEQKPVATDMTTLLAGIGSPSQRSHETSSP